jgi:predicted AlkP superfamily pyrophosphatase or phosphodiesterase
MQKIIIALFFSTISLQAWNQRHVVLISIDGLHPDMYLDSTWPAPNLRRLMREGVYALHMKSVFPAYTYPSHTAMLTGALPARSGICYNQPKGSHGEWNWFVDSIRVPTIWKALKMRGLTTAAVEWPCSVSGDITYDIPEIWDVKHPEDRITAARNYTTPGLIEAVEQNATGKLDSNNFKDGSLMLDENAGRMAAYIIEHYRPAFLALHFAEVDGMEHDFGRDGDSVRLALESADRAIGDVLEGIARSGAADSTTVLIVGDHGFSDIHTVIRPNVLIQGLPGKFIAAGGSAFLYANGDTTGLTGKVREKLEAIPAAKRSLFRILDRTTLDQMGADSAAILALSAIPGTVFSGAVKANLDPFGETHGGHHGYDPNDSLMYTGFIAEGAGIRHGGVIQAICVTDIAPLVATLLGVSFSCPDGQRVDGILLP